jgi:hypothetical protein
MRKILLAIAVLAAGGAWAQSSKSMTDQPKDAAKSAGDTASQGMSKMAGSEISGHVSKLDKDSRSLTLALPSGDQQSLKVASDAKITRDGASVGLDQVKSGDSVRASFDPTTNQATSLTVMSKSDSSMPKSPK